VLGIELVNEPHRDVPMDTLRNFYQAAYLRVRKHLSAQSAAVVFHDGFRAMQWGTAMQAPQYQNVILDTHLYQCFGDTDRGRDLQAHVTFAEVQRKRELDTIRKSHRCIVGEWSCALPGEATRGITGAALDPSMRAYGQAQLASYDTADGWFFWTYRTETSKSWNFRHCVEHGWLPDKYGG
jgi:glucan 1,3-beta-glucosidase